MKGIHLLFSTYLSDYLLSMLYPNGCRVTMCTSLPSYLKKMSSYKYYQEEKKNTTSSRHLLFYDKSVIKGRAPVNQIRAPKCMIGCGRYDVASCLQDVRIISIVFEFPLVCNKSCLVRTDPNNMFISLREINILFGSVRTRHDLLHTNGNSNTIEILDNNKNV